jgi:hypothetical protein
MSNRFHSKYHRHNHHTINTEDSRYPDAGHDPIASPESPFLGDFVMLGTLSAAGLPNGSGYLERPAGLFTSNDTALVAAAPLSGVAFLANGNVKILGNLSAANVFLNGVSTPTPSTATTTGTFLVIDINNVPYGIRLWNLT